MGATITLALGVTPEKLKEKSTVVRSDISTMESEINKLIDRIKATSSYWKGEAGNAQRAKMEESVPVLNAMIQRLNSYPDKLETIAGIYTKAETQNLATASATKTDIFMV